ncbi:MAG: M48 family metallopeptidase [Pseudomonadales bacterium]|jgi:predicted Zn-dependent protease
MGYSNPKIPEGVNISSEHPLKEFLILAVGLMVAAVFAVFILSVFAQFFALKIPFKTELDLIRTYQETLVSEKMVSENIGRGENLLKIEAYLQGLADSLAGVQNLPEGMLVQVNYIDDDTVNAFATLGGQIMIHRGLLEQLPHENSLVMVLAHEIAHIRFRDPIVSLGRGITIALSLAVILNATDTGMFDSLLGQAGLLTAMSFSREQESRADQAALDALSQYYGHIGGSEELFDIFAMQREVLSPPSFLSTHPLTQERIDEARAYASDHELKENVEFRPLPDWLQNSLYP